ncbi:universal stress protein A-like protein [Mangifera indica]|uniref:universal stress protein A-like protein n=1 Tax=Mangifera indica TaxID=29780 RepID=UPI001CF96A86|nr:universal stress protein A-like protein [Mangifera indica]
MEDQERTSILVTVTKSSEKGYPYPSKCSREAFEWILENIVRTNVGRFDLLFLHVQHPNTPDAEYVAAVDMLDYFDDRCIQIGVAHFSWVARGVDPKVVICDQVKQMNADILVLGNKKRASIQRFFNRGESVIEYCSKQAECHVITVNVKAEAAQRSIVLQEELDPNSSRRNLLP